MTEAIDTVTIGWIPYRPDEEEQHVSPARWGKDHWSTLAYLETRTVDHRGIIKNANMRCNARRHRPFANIAGGHLMDGASYPTRLNDGDLPNHDDWDCAQDIAAAGYIRLWWTEPIEHESAFGYAQARVEFTGEGLYVAHALRAHLAAGHNTASFRGPGAPS